MLQSSLPDRDAKEIEGSEQPELEADERELEQNPETTGTSSTNSADERDLQSQAIPAEDHEPQPVLDHDAEGHSRLPARIPGDDDDEPADVGSPSPPEIGLEGAEEVADDTDSEDAGPSLGQMEFIVPLPLAGQARDQYRKTVKYHEELVERFTSRKWTDPPTLLSDAEVFVQTMRDITTHIDLTNETTMTQTAVDPADVVEWDRSVSTKFKLVYHLLVVLKELKMHVGLVAQQGRTLEILENFLTGMHISYARSDGSHPLEETAGPLTVTVFPSDVCEISSSVPALALVVAFGCLSDAKKLSMHALRQHSGRLAPLLSLAVINSVDHIDHSVAPMFTGAHRLRIVVNCLAKLRKEAGRNDIGMASVEECSSEIARFVLMNGTEAQWPLLPIGMLAHNDAWDLAQGMVSMKSSASSDSEKSAKAKAAAKKGQKRPLDRVQDDDMESGKRMRLTPQPDLDTSTTRISDSLGQLSQVQLSGEINALKDLLKATEQQLHETTSHSDTRIRGMDDAISELQQRFEEQTLEKRVLAKEITETKMILEHIKRQKDARDATVEKLKDEIRALKTQLSEAHVALQGSQIPEVAELEKLRQEKDKAEEAKRRADKAAQSEKVTMEYMRTEMEEARSRAGELAQLNRDYVARISILEQQASGEISKARQLFLDDRAKHDAADNIRLSQETLNLKQLLQRKEEELKTRKVGMGTRAGSVPRSPRVGPSSRAGSPIPDRRIGALKSNMNL